MLYSDSETAWLERRAGEVAERTGWPFPIAYSEAGAEMARMRERAACDVVILAERRTCIREQKEVTDGDD